MREYKFIIITSLPHQLTEKLDKKLSKNIDNLSTTNHLDLTAIYGTLHLTTEEYNSFQLHVVYTPRQTMYIWSQSKFQ